MAKTKYKIFVINLERSESRWKAMCVQLERLGLPFERFSAVDGREISDEVLRRHYSAELNRRKYYVDLSRSEIACYISHLKVCEKILSENLDYAIILEDDIILDAPFKFVPQALESITVKWKYIKLIAPFKRKKIVSREPVVFETSIECNSEKQAHGGNAGTQLASNFPYAISFPHIFELVRWKKPPAGTQAYAITKDGAKEFLAKRSRFFRPIDVDLQFTWETKLDVQGLLPSFCKIADISSEISRKKRYHYPLARLVFKLKSYIGKLVYLAKRDGTKVFLKRIINLKSKSL